MNKNNISTQHYNNYVLYINSIACATCYHHSKFVLFSAKDEAPCSNFFWRVLVFIRFCRYLDRKYLIFVSNVVIVARSERYGFINDKEMSSGSFVCICGENWGVWLNSKPDYWCLLCFALERKKPRATYLFSYQRNKCYSIHTIFYRYNLWFMSIWINNRVIVQIRKTDLFLHPSEVHNWMN